MPTTVQKHMQKIAAKNANIVLLAKLCIMAELESNNLVYTANAYASFASYGFSKHQFAGALSTLTKEGSYKAIDDHFGQFVQKND